MSRDYGFHAILLVEGEDRGDVAAQLRDVANRIEQDEPLVPHTVKVLARPSGQEVPFAGRWYGVCSDGEELSPPWALFSTLEQAARFVKLADADKDGEWPSNDGGMGRCDVALSLWNCIDDDPHAAERFGHGQ